MSSYIVNSEVERTVYLTLSGVPVTGITSAGVNVMVKKPGEKFFTALVTSPSNWSDIGGGFYTLTFDSALTASQGTFAYVVSGPDFNNIVFDQFVLMDPSLNSLQQSYFQDIPVERTVFLSLTGTPAADVPSSGVVCKIKKTGHAAFSTKALNTDNWINLGDGFYVLKFSAQDMSRVGSFAYTLAGTDFDNFTYEEFSVLTPADVTMKDKCLLRGQFINLAGTSAQQIKVCARAVEYPARSGQRVVSGDVIWTQLDYDGKFELPLLRGATVIIEVPRAAIRHQIVIPDAPSAELTDLLPPFAVNYNS